MGFHTRTIQALEKQSSEVKARANKLAADLVQASAGAFPLGIAVESNHIQNRWKALFPDEPCRLDKMAVTFLWRVGKIREVDGFASTYQINPDFVQGDTSRSPLIQRMTPFDGVAPEQSDPDNKSKMYPALMVTHRATKCPVASLPLYLCKLLRSEPEWVMDTALRLGKKAQFYYEKGVEIVDLDTVADNASDKAKELRRAVKLLPNVVLPEETTLAIGSVLARFIEEDASRAPRGLLLHGPPGTGKTLIAKEMAESIPAAKFFSLSLPDLKQGYLGQSGQAVRQIWQQVKEAGTAVLFVDECEGVFSRRGGVSSDVLQAEIVQAFLAEWDGLSAKDNTHKCLVVGATNRLDLIDEAIVSRFEQSVEVPLPDAKARVYILHSELGGTLPFAESKIAECTNGFSGRDLRTLAKQIRSKALEGHLSERELSAACQKIRGRVAESSEHKLTWDDLVLEASAKENLQTVCSMLQHADVLAEQGISLPRGLLLYGPPGTGKTLIAKVMAAESGMTFLSASTAEIKAGYIGQSGQKVRELFERARSQSPCILFIDEIDILTPSRSSGDSFNKEIVGQMLQELDGVRKHPGHVFILAATNCMEEVDAAILSRFPTRQNVPLPSTEERSAIIQTLLKGKPSKLTKEEIDLIADNTSGASGRDLRSLLEDAEKKAVRRAIKNGDPRSVVITFEDWSILPPPITTTHGTPCSIASCV
jgi:SpoVK/Ycf46/Vps4 family AAA+-type ATPase